MGVNTPLPRLCCTKGLPIIPLLLYAHPCASGATKLTGRSGRASGRPSQEEIHRADDRAVRNRSRQGARRQNGMEQIEPRVEAVGAWP